MRAPQPPARVSVNRLWAWSPLVPPACPFDGATLTGRGSSEQFERCGEVVTGQLVSDGVDFHVRQVDAA